MFLKRKPRTRLTVLKQEVCINPKSFKPSLSFKEGAKVDVKTQRGEDEKWTEGQIIDKISNYTYLVETDSKTTLIHIDDLKLRVESELANSNFERQQVLPDILSNEPVILNDEQIATESEVQTSDSEVTDQTHQNVSLDNIPFSPEQELCNNEVARDLRRSQRTVKPPSRPNLLKKIYCC